MKINFMTNFFLSFPFENSEKNKDILRKELTQILCVFFICHELLRNVCGFCSTLIVVICIKWNHLSIEAHKMEQI